MQHLIIIEIGHRLSFFTLRAARKVSETFKRKIRFTIGRPLEEPLYTGGLIAD